MRHLLTGMQTRDGQAGRAHEMALAARARQRRSRGAEQIIGQQTIGSIWVPVVGGPV